METQYNGVQSSPNIVLYILLSIGILSDKLQPINFCFCNVKIRQNILSCHCGLCSGGGTQTMKQRNVGLKLKLREPR